MSNKKIQYKFGEKTDLIIKAFFQTYNELGIGFEKQTYINSLQIILKNFKLNSSQHYPNEIIFKNEIVGNKLIDVLVDDQIIVQISTDKNMEPYKVVRASKFEVALLFNFGNTPQFSRKEANS